MTPINDHFTADNYVARHTSGHNALDPNSLLTGAEIQAGFGYENPRRFADQHTYDVICSGNVSSVLIPLIAPRDPSLTPMRIVDGPFPGPGALSESVVAFS